MKLPNLHPTPIKLVSKDSLEDLQKSFNQHISKGKGSQSKKRIRTGYAGLESPYSSSSPSSPLSDKKTNNPSLPSALKDASRCSRALNGVSHQRWHYRPLVLIAIGLLVLGGTVTLDLRTSNLLADAFPGDVIAYVRGVLVLSFIAIGLAVLGFLQSYHNTRGFLGRLILYFFIFGFSAGGYYFAPNISVQWQANSGWQYAYVNSDFTLID